MSDASSVSKPNKSPKDPIPPIHTPHSHSFSSDLAGTTTGSPVLSRRSIHRLLGGSGGMDSGHQTLHNSKLIIDHLGKRGQTVGGARGIGDDLHLGIVLVKIDTANKHGGISRGGRDDTKKEGWVWVCVSNETNRKKSIMILVCLHLLGSTDKMGLCLVRGGKDTSRLDDIFGTGFTPSNLLGILFSKDGDFLAIHPQFAVLCLDGALETAVRGIILDHVDPRDKSE